MSLKTKLMAGLLVATLPQTVLAGNEWSYGFGMGTAEYIVDDRRGSRLYIACPEGHGKPISATFTTHGYDYHSPKKIMSLSFVIDGVEYDDPFATSPGLQEHTFVNDFWPALLKANSLAVRADGYEVYWLFAFKGVEKI